VRQPGRAILLQAVADLAGQAGRECTLATAIAEYVDLGKTDLVDGPAGSLEIGFRFPRKLDTSTREPRNMPCFPGSSCIFGILAAACTNAGKTAENRRLRVSLTPGRPRPARAGCPYRDPTGATAVSPEASVRDFRSRWENPTSSL